VEIPPSAPLTAHNMPTAILVISLFTASIAAAQNTVILVKTFKSLHHHTTRAAYRHVVKPVAHAVKKVAE
jgi:hypothetical protein